MNKVLAFEIGLHAFVKSQCKTLEEAIESSKDLSSDNEKILIAAIDKFKSTAVY
jgi:F-type H+/Na+-transporting ATPase subunit alpha